MRRRKQRGSGRLAPYQQWDTAFSAYTGDAIKLTPDFFTSLKEDSRVTLTFLGDRHDRLTSTVFRARGAATLGPLRCGPPSPFPGASFFGSRMRRPVTRASRDSVRNASPSPGRPFARVDDGWAEPLS
ncbi:hypothetical protein ACIBVL_19675 [Streptomyces sp. NPDC049687]|uniref:hypothetical protein n=1 Tax=Streptomyces sp. NPDC049687 TaxID=3365596 RepID=UPI0037A6EC17